MLGWTQDELATRSGVSKRTIAALEIEWTVPKRNTVDLLVHALEAAGIEFRRAKDYAPGVFLRAAKPCPVDAAPSPLGADPTISISDREDLPTP